MFVCVREKVLQRKQDTVLYDEIAPDMLQGMFLKYITARLEGCQECVCVHGRERARSADKVYMCV